MDNFGFGSNLQNKKIIVCLPAGKGRLGAIF